MSRKKRIMISACLLGICCRYDGKASRSPALLNFINYYNFIPFCPEQMGGLPTPRIPAEMKNGDGYDVLTGSARLINDLGEDVTDAFVKGACEALKLHRISWAEAVILKDRSPSCGVLTPYCEKKGGMGIGVTAALFKLNGIDIFELGQNDPFPNQLPCLDRHNKK